MPLLFDPTSRTDLTGALEHLKLACEELESFEVGYIAPRLSVWSTEVEPASWLRL